MNGRLEKLSAALEKAFGANYAAIITKCENIFYFLGINTAGAGALVLAGGKAYFIIDSRYIEAAQNTVKGAEIILQGRLYSQIAEIIHSANAKITALENTLSLFEYNKIKARLGEVETAADDTLTDAIEELRSIKDENELAAIYEAQHITDKAFLHMLSFIKEGKTERECALELDYFMQKNGAEGMAFETILISGAKTSMPHGVPGDNIIKKGDFVTMDFGAKYGGYCTDMTRTVAVGSVTDEMREVYNIVYIAQKTAAEAVKSGCIGGDIDKTARDIISNAGYGKYFGHALGHSVGLEIHEKPTFSPLNKKAVYENTVITVEPGIYLPGKFGVRIEDTVVVKKNGCHTEGKTDKKLIII